MVDPYGHTRVERYHPWGFSKVPPQGLRTTGLYLHNVGRLVLSFTHEFQSDDSV